MNERERQLSAFHMALQLGFTITVPLVLFALGGRLLDQRFGTHPWLLLTGIILSMVVSSVLVVWKALQLMKDVNKKETTKNDTKNDLSSKPSGH